MVLRVSGRKIYEDIEGTGRKRRNGRVGVEILVETRTGRSRLITTPF